MMANEEVSRVDKNTALRAGVIGVVLIIIGAVSDIAGIVLLWESNSELDGVFLRRAHGIWSGVLVCRLLFFSLLLCLM